MVSPKKHKVSITLFSFNLILKKNNYIADIEPVAGVHCIEPQSRTHSKISELPDQLTTLLNQVSDKLNEKDEVENTLTEFEVMFIKPDGKLCYTGSVEHNINTRYGNPIEIPPRRPSKQKEIVDTELSKMLEQNTTERNNSSWSAAVVLVSNFDGSIRFCIHFHKLNSRTKKDAYPLKRIDNALEALFGAQ